MLNLFLQSLPALIERAEGFSQALTWQPTLELCKLRQEVFAGCHAKEEDNAQSFVSPGEVTPTDTGTSKNPYTLFKRKRAADSPQRRYYPLRRRKITLSAWIPHFVFSDWILGCTLARCIQSFIFKPYSTLYFSAVRGSFLNYLAFDPYMYLSSYCYNGGIWQPMRASNIWYPTNVFTD